MYIAEYSDLHPKERRQLAWKRRYKADCPEWDDSMVLLTKLVRSSVRGGGAVLDIGCGRGNFVLDELAGHFIALVGIDADPHATQGNISVGRIVYGDIQERLPFHAAAFDAVVSLWVMEHVSKPEQLWREVARILKPGGAFALVTPNARSLIVRMRSWLPDRLATRIVRALYGREDKDTFPVFYRANTTRAIRRLAGDAGLKVEVLIENADPSYTSRGPATYWVSRLCTRLPWGLGKPHIIAILRKP
ncbi:class I SAM-dependent methyltransferase [Candidatus Uhrbacteria bacterium]|nr:class I SAM-dependent methyltransferase [Candidatus Uhrbacteria bacterium]